MRYARNWDLYVARRERKWSGVLSTICPLGTSHWFTALTTDATLQLPFCHQPSRSSPLCNSVFSVQFLEEAYISCPASSTSPTQKFCLISSLYAGQSYPIESPSIVLYIHNSDFFSCRWRWRKEILTPVSLFISFLFF